MPYVNAIHLSLRDSLFSRLGKVVCILGRMFWLVQCFQARPETNLLDHVTFTCINGMILPYLQLSSEPNLLDS
jgi:hypothetical protein